MNGEGRELPGPRDTGTTPDSPSLADLRIPALAEIELFCRSVYGTNAVGLACWTKGIGGHLNANGKYVFDRWEEQREFAYPNLSGARYRDMLDAAAESDVYLSPYLMQSGQRTKANAVSLRLLHCDWDGNPDALASCLEKINGIDGFATLSGTPGHLHVFVPLAHEVTADRHRQLLEMLRHYLPPGADHKKAASDVLRPVGTLNHKDRARGGVAAQVVWAIKPTGATVDPDTLARLIGRDSRPPAQRTAKNGAVVGRLADDELPEAVRRAVDLVTRDRSEDTARVVGAGADAGLTLPQIRTVVDSRADLAERVAEFLDRDPPVDDVLNCWLKVVDSRQVKKRERIEGEEFFARHAETPGIATDSAAEIAAAEIATGLDITGIEDGFWDSRDSLKLIYTTALAHMCSPWAVLGCCAARALTQVRPNATLPPLIGGRGSLNWFAAIAARSGGGKGSANAVARQLVPGDVTVRNVGSGEGIINCYIERQCKKIVGQRESVLFNVDEVDTLAALGNRSGSTMIGILRCAFSGEALGFSYVTRGGEHIPAHSYRLTLVVGVQPARAGGLMSDAAGGTPQRFQWFPGTDSRVTDQVSWVETRRQLVLPDHSAWRYPREIQIPGTAASFIRREHARNQRGETDALDGHAVFVREKFAFALAVLDGRHAMSEEDWELSAIAALVSDATRAWVSAELESAAASEAAELGRRRGDHVRCRRRWRKLIRIRPASTGYAFG